MALQKKDKTITHLLTLQKARDVIRLELQESYSEKITPFAEIILQVMKAHNCNEFDAIGKIINNNPLYKQPGGELFFGCALLEIVEGKYFSEFAKK